MRTKAKTILILMIIFLFSGVLSCSMAETNENDYLGVWYLDAVRDPKNGSFGEDYFYTAEYGVAGMMIILNDGTAEHIVAPYDRYFNNNSDIIDAMYPTGDRTIELRNGKLYYIDQDNIVTHVYSKASAKEWYLEDINEEASLSDFAGKWNLVAMYQLENEVVGFSSINESLLKSAGRICVKNWADEEDASSYLDYSMYQNDNSGFENGVYSFISSEQSEIESLEGKFSSFKDIPGLKILTTGKQDADGLYRVSFQSLYNGDFLAVFRVLYTSDEWKDGIDPSEGTVHSRFWLYEKSIQQDK